MTTDLIATEIRNQLGQKALYMMGAYDMLATERGLHFKFRGSKKCNAVQIVLCSDDTYHVEFVKYQPLKLTSRGLTGGTIKTVREFHGMYAEQLHTLIEIETGLRLSL